MLNFEFQNPTRIVFGKDTVPQLDKLVPADARVLILYGGQSAERTGTLAEGDGTHYWIALSSQKGFKARLQLEVQRIAPEPDAQGVLVGTGSPG